MVCKALGYSSYRGLGKDGQVEIKVKGELLGVMRICPLLQSVPALRCRYHPGNSSSANFHPGAQLSLCIS